MVKDSATHDQAMCRWFAHPLGIYKAVRPLNNLSRLKTRHSELSLGLIYPESNWSNVKNAVDAFRVQLDLNTSNGGTVHQVLMSPANRIPSLMSKNLASK